ncbi:MAG: hypothetical protein ABIH72_02210 [archaeon]
MVLVSEIKYKPNIVIGSCPKDSDEVVGVLRDVKKDLAEVDISIKGLNLKQILEIAGRNGFLLDNKEGPGVIQVKFDSVRPYLRVYQENTGEGCKSCAHYALHKPQPDETFAYCSILEDKSDATNNHSPIIRGYMETGCLSKADRFQIKPKDLEGMF